MLFALLIIHRRHSGHVEFEDYKGTRKPSPEEFKVQMPMLKEALSALGPGFCGASRL